MGRRQTISPDRLLDAAEAVVAEKGVACLTFEAVAERAGVSKGGLLYTFPTKEALLQAMLGRLSSRFESAAVRALESLPEDEPGRLAQAHALASLTGVAPDRVSVAMLAAAAQNLGLLAPMKQKYVEAVQRVSDGGMSHARAAAICLAADGLWMFELLGISPLSPAQRCAFLAELLNLARDGVSRAGEDVRLTPAEEPLHPSR